MQGLVRGFQYLHDLIREGLAIPLLNMVLNVLFRESQVLQSVLTATLCSRIVDHIHLRIVLITHSQFH